MKFEETRVHPPPNKRSVGNSDIHTVEPTRVGDSTKTAQTNNNYPRDWFIHPTNVPNKNQPFYGCFQK